MLSHIIVALLRSAERDEGLGEKSIRRTNIF